MKINNLFLFALILFGIKNTAQDHKTLSLKDAVSLVITNSSEANLANTKILTSKLELESLKNNQYPSVKISGEYLRLTGANVNSKIGGNSSGSSPLEVSQLLLGQANVAMPLFNGFKLKNNIDASENLYKSQVYTASQTKEELAVYVVELFANLYKAQEMLKIFEENSKSANQRSKDFSAMVDNGLLARNDLLKAQLQESTIQISIETAIKNINIINYQLVTLLHLPEKTIIDIDIETVKKDMAASQLKTVTAQRNDIEALIFKQKASESGIKIAKGGYYPSLSLVGGYIALDLKNVISVTNAMNFGIGFNYDIASIFKNGKEVELAKSKSLQTQQSLNILSDKVKEEIQEANENYTLSIKQNKVYNQAVEQATENYRIVKDKYDNSLATTTELLEADNQQLQSKINFSLSQAEVALKYYQLQFASGKLINSFNITLK